MVAKAWHASALRNGKTLRPPRPVTRASAARIAPLLLGRSISPMRCAFSSRRRGSLRSLISNPSRNRARGLRARSKPRSAKSKRAMRRLPGNMSRNRGRVPPFLRRSMRSKLDQRPNRLTSGSLGTRSRRPSPRPKLRRNSPRLGPRSRRLPPDLPSGSLGTRSRRPSPRPKLRRNSPPRSPNPPRRPKLRRNNPRRSPNPPNSRSAVPNPRTPLVPASLPV